MTELVITVDQFIDSLIYGDSSEITALAVAALDRDSAHWKAMMETDRTEAERQLGLIERNRKRLGEQ